MADSIPAPLRQADITRFMNRANQVRQFKPAIAYWCHYWVVNQILAKQLHNVDEECLTYTTGLMDSLEETKTERPNDEAIMDDSVGQAVIEEFAQQTFERAERTMKANKVTRQTADTFDAAATFLQLLNIWGQADGEAQKKIKYAKWNAARILKAIRAGEDPNESNPKQEEEDGAESALPELDVNDPEVQKVAGSSAAHPVTIEDDPDTEFFEQQKATPSGAAAEESEPTLSGLGATPSQDAPNLPSVADLNPPSLQSPGYFPPAQQSMPSSPGGAAETAPDTAPEFPASSPAQSSHARAPPAPPSNAASSPPPEPQQTPRHVGPPSAKPRAYAAPVPTAAPTQATDESDVPGATKHARFAISALNFEDVPTAVKELRAALGALGAQ